MLTIQSHPPWLKKRLKLTGDTAYTKDALKSLAVDTVCESSLCPNLNECFSKKFATFLILGNRCTRRCPYCAIAKADAGGEKDDEVGNILDAIKMLDLKYVVITSVTRDDISDGGASRFVGSVRAVRRYSKEIKIELLVPDFRGERESIEAVVDISPDVLGHNVETVERLYKSLRPQADYQRSLGLLKLAKKLNPRQLTKSSAMLGLGETESEVAVLMRDLRDADCDLFALGQYLKPRPENVPAERFVRPEEFMKYAELGYSLGFKHVSAGPFVRSSYCAEEAYLKVMR